MTRAERIEKAARALVRAWDSVDGFHEAAHAVQRALPALRAALAVPEEPAAAPPRHWEYRLVDPAMGDEVDLSQPAPAPSSGTPAPEHTHEWVGYSAGGQTWWWCECGATRDGLAPGGT